MNTNYKCNCCAKESVCKYSVEYKQDCGAILSCDLRQDNRGADSLLGVRAHRAYC